MHLYTDLIIHRYIYDRSLSGDQFHIVNPFLNAKGLFKCHSTHIPNQISARQSVCLSLSDLGFNRVVKWNCWMKQQSKTQKQGALTAIQTGCLGALHGSQYLNMKPK